MKNKKDIEGAKEFLLELLKGCYQVIREDMLWIIYWIYEPEDNCYIDRPILSYDEIKKLNIYFVQNDKCDYFYVDYYKVWSKFGSDFGLNYLEIKEMINDTLVEHTYLHGYTPSYRQPIRVY